MIEAKVIAPPNSGVLLVEPTEKQAVVLTIMSRGRYSFVKLSREEIISLRVALGEILGAWD